MEYIKNLPVYILTIFTENIWFYYLWPHVK